MKHHVPNDSGILVLVRVLNCQDDLVGARCLIWRTSKYLRVFYRTLDLQPISLGKQTREKRKMWRQKTWSHGLKSRERISNSAGAVRRCTHSTIYTFSFLLDPGFHCFKSVPEKMIGRAGQVLLQLETKLSKAELRKVYLGCAWIRPELVLLALDCVLSSQNRLWTPLS